MPCLPSHGPEGNGCQTLCGSRLHSGSLEKNKPQARPGQCLLSIPQIPVEINCPPSAIYLIGQFGPSGCLSHPSSFPLRRSSTHLARSWGLLGEAVSGSASWLESLTIQTPPHLQVPCPVPPPCSELCKSRLAGGSRPYRPLVPRGGPVQRQF